MKKTTIIIAFSSLVLNLYAQNEVTTQKFDLETDGLQKRYKFYPGFTNDKGEVVVKMGKPASCDVDKDSWTGTKTYKGVKWDFIELKFDNSLNYVGKTEKSFENSMQALSYAPMFGEKFNPEPGNITDGGSPNGITADYIGKRTVVPTISLTNFKVSSFEFYGQVKTNPEGTVCWETIMSQKVNSILAKEEKGQKWIAQNSFHYPGGGDILFATDGVYPEANMHHFVFKRYNENLDVEKSIYIPFNYNTAFNILPIELEGGKKDYVMICQSAAKYAKEMPVKPADFVEFIYIDGTTFEIKYRTESTLKFSAWNAAQVIKNPNGFYIVGPAGEDNTTNLDMPGQISFSDISMGKILTCDPKTLPNYQIMSVNHSAGKIEWVNGTSKDQATPLTSVIAGTDIKAKADPIFTFPSITLNAWGNSGAKADFRNNKIIISGQQTLKPGSYSKPVEDRGHMVTMIFDAKGNLEKYFIKPEEVYSTFQTFYSKDDKTMYWACYELGELNTMVEENGIGLISKRVPSMIAANLHFVKIDLDKSTSSDVQAIGKEEYAVSYSNPLLAEGDDSIVLMGRTLSKKAKDSELILIKIKK